MELAHVLPMVLLMRSMLVSSALLLGSYQLAFAQQEAPAGEATAAPSAQVLTAVQDKGGVHAMLVRSADGSMAALMGKAGALKSLDIVSVHRSGPSFVVDTIQEGIVNFNTRDHRVTIPGDVGFIQSRPTRTFTNKASSSVIKDVIKQSSAKPQAQTIQANSSKPARSRKAPTRSTKSPAAKLAGTRGLAKNTKTQKRRAAMKASRAVKASPVAKKSRRAAAKTRPVKSKAR